MTSEAGVISQQSVLSFSTLPPSPFGAHNLPRAIYQSRGHKGFAMNHHTQLQLCLDPGSSGMATSFNPTPSPVVVDKSLGAFNCVSAERLALAVRMARRAIQTGKLQTVSQQSFVQDQHVDNNVPGSPVVCCPVAPYSQMNLSPRPQTDHECQCVTVQPPVDQLDVKDNQVDETKPLPTSKQSSRELARLRGELQQQINILKQFNGNKRIVHTPKVKGQQNSGRVWMDESEDSVEREKRRRSEQVAREARIVYNLKQQVASLKRDVDRLQEQDSKEGLQSARKTKTVRKLAATHRAALRTLVNYQGHSPQHIPPELALLLLQLNLMSSELGVTEGSIEELQQAIQQIKCDPMLERSPERPPPITGRTKQKKKTAPTLPGHKRSIIRNQPTKRKSRKPPLYRSTPAPPSKHTREATHKAPASHLTHRQTIHRLKKSPCTNEGTNDPSIHSVRTNDPSRKSSPLTNAPPTTPIKTVSVSSSPWQPGPVHLNDDGSIDYEHVMFNRHGDAEQTLSSEGDSPSNNNHLIIQPNSEMTSSQPLSVKQTKVAMFLDQLQRLETESDAIRERWTTIVYEDPLTSQATCVNISKGKETKKEPFLCALSPEMLSSVSKYKERYLHYLYMTGVTTQGGFDPWSMAESIADSLLEDQLGAVVKEVGHVCDSYIDTMYRGEFARPHTETT